MRRLQISEEKLTELYEEGKNDREIGEILGVSADMVYLRRKQIGLTSKFEYKSKLDYNQVVALVDQGLSDYSIAPILGVNHCTVFQFRKKNNIERPSMVHAIEVEPTERQISVLIGHVLGDGYLKRFEVNTGGTISQGEKQQAYAEWKHNELRSLCTELVRRERKTVDPRTGIYYVSYDAHIRNNPALNWLYDRFYINGVKRITSDVLSNYDELSLAVHFMDDGSKQKPGYGLAMHCFTKRECIEFCMFLMRRFTLYATVHESNNVYISGYSANRFVELIGPHIIPSMQYKLHDTHLCHVTP